MVATISPFFIFTTIYLCVKHIPDTAANIKVTGDAEFDESVKFVVNPYDEYGVEEAIQIVKKNGGEAVVVTVGKETAVNTMRYALALGAARGILVKTETQFLDSSLTGLALRRAIREDGAPNLIFSGKQSVDSEGSQTHYRLSGSVQHFAGMKTGKINHESTKLRKLEKKMT